MAETRSRPMTTRREFVATAAAAFATRYTRWLPRGDHLPLGFSTLGCPAWTWPQILDFAAAHGYVAVELRGLQATMDLSQAPELAPGRLEEAKRQLAGHGLSVSDLGASAQMHEMDPRKHAAQLAEARRFIDLAQALGAPYVRVFGNNYVKYVPRADMLAHIARGLRELGDYARPKGVTVRLESHGDFTDPPSLLQLLRLAALVLLCLDVAPSAPRVASRVAPPAPLRVYSLRADALARAKRRLASGDSSLRPAYDRLVREAAAALVAGPFSVMDKQRTPPSGDKHDYVSMGPDWWPDATKPGGLPYA